MLESPNDIHDVLLLKEKLKDGVVVEHYRPLDDFVHVCQPLAVFEVLAGLEDVEEFAYVRWPQHLLSDPLPLEPSALCDGLHNLWQISKLGGWQIHRPGAAFLTSIAVHLVGLDLKLVHGSPPWGSAISGAVVALNLENLAPDVCAALGFLKAQCDLGAHLGIRPSDDGVISLPLVYVVSRDTVDEERRCVLLRYDHKTDGVGLLHVLHRHVAGAIVIP
mmetsp:Transcript_36846/g.103966  ORF Transcript_36846/g.103966 Transcript_36846/m.103966 type:complete len:219 (-) Transcript_36846:367-1023(-)